MRNFKSHDHYKWHRRVRNRPCHRYGARVARAPSYQVRAALLSPTFPMSKWMCDLLTSPLFHNVPKDECRFWGYSGMRGQVYWHNMCPNRSTVSNLDDDEGSSEGAQSFSGTVHWINSQTASAILDTGASITCTNETVFKSLLLQLIKHASIIVRRLTSSKETLGRVCVQLATSNTTKEVKLHVLSGMRTQALLGSDNNAYFHLKLDLSLGKLKQDDILPINGQPTLPQGDIKSQQQRVGDSDACQYFKQI